MAGEALAVAAEAAAAAVAVDAAMAGGAAAAGEGIIAGFSAIIITVTVFLIFKKLKQVIGEHILEEDK